MRVLPAFLMFPYFSSYPYCYQEICISYKRLYRHFQVISQTERENLFVKSKYFISFEVEGRGYFCY